ncbi:DUF3263 domain-containing protein [Phycicoccus sp. Root101]|uniref:DUF3263 domain-containing protein n=1 Tax=Phycicoccus sp. Root101 TaxID=1736421 RepID=UPI0007033A6A|nr:DUF3263 domain-containing protein [Phycicoccus sp. Root101]KQU71069.1 hypothetical protein ASC58_03745 [Phycicoccus sp. Root101]
MTDMDMAFLDFEREWWRHAGAKDDDVAQRWGIKAAEYDRRLFAIAASPEALFYDATTVRRVRRRLVRPDLRGVC